MSEAEFLKGFVLKFAIQYGWEKLYYKQEKQVIGFRNKDHGCHMDIYLRSKRVLTLLRHPKFGVSILERTGVGITDMRRIFEDPRVHTKNGRRI